MCSTSCVGFNVRNGLLVGSRFCKSRIWKEFINKIIILYSLIILLFYSCYAPLLNCCYLLYSNIGNTINNVVVSAVKFVSTYTYCSISISVISICATTTTICIVFLLNFTVFYFDINTWYYYFSSQYSILYYFYLSCLHLCNCCHYLLRLCCYCCCCYYYCWWSDKYSLMFHYLLH